MLPSIDRLDFRIYLVDGGVLEYAQSDPTLASQNLKRMTPSNLFSLSLALIAGEFHATTIQTEFVTSVDLVFDGEVDWSFGPNLHDIVEISRSEFDDRVRQASADETFRRDQTRKEGEEFVGYDHIRLVGGSEVFLEVRGTTRIRAVQARAMTRFFESSCILARLRDRGFKVINPRKVVSIAYYPGSPESPDTVWHGNPTQAPATP